MTRGEGGKNWDFYCDILIEWPLKFERKFELGCREACILGEVELAFKISSYSEFCCIVFLRPSDFFVSS